ncbi:hypothetical protein I7I48_09621 [Histoplasma ohiense]|nr:hypothetical protein I7I48_09621 [Histoplasma ohiense (nom. inval.)]
MLNIYSGSSRVVGVQQVQVEKLPLDIFHRIFFPFCGSRLVFPSQQTTQSRLADQIAPDLVAATARKVYKPVEICKPSHLSSHPHSHTHPTSLKF